MSETETDTAPGADDARTIARRHTTQLLKQLRGYGPRDEPSTSATSQPAAVAEIPSGYARLLEAVPNRLPPAQPDTVVSVAAPPSAPAQPFSSPKRRECRDSIPTVGELLVDPPKDVQQGELGALLAQAGQLIRHTHIFRAYLPPHLLDHAVLVRLDQEQWTVHTDSASWATRLRYALYNIRVALGQQLKIPLPKPHIRVIPPALAPQPHWPRLTLTERNAQLLEVTARTMSSTRLSAALRRLATRGGTPPDSSQRDA